MKPLTPYIAISGAFERDNFGDLLFGIVTEKLLHPMPVVRVGLHSRSLEEFGSPSVYSTRALTQFAKAHPPTAFLCVGGELFMADPQNGMRFNTPPDLYQAYMRLLPPNRRRYTEMASGRASGLAYVPWSDLNFHFPQEIPILLNSCGGSSLADDPALTSQVLSYLSDVNFLSVRDQRTLDSLQNQDRCRLAPDVVTLIDETCNEEVSAAKHDLLKENDLLSQPYLIFQAKDRYLNEPSSAAQAICSVANKYRLNVVFQPAGLASGHDSFEAMEQLGVLVNNGLVNTTSYVQRNRNVFCQVAALANASLVIASSLHCRIIAAAYAVPRVTISNGKVAAYINTWESDLGMKTYALADIPKAVDTALSFPHDVWNMLRNTQVELAKKNFASLRAHLPPRTYTDAVNAPLSTIKESLLLLESELLRRDLLSHVVASESEGDRRLWRTKSRLRPYWQRLRRFLQPRQRSNSR